MSSHNSSQQQQQSDEHRHRDRRPTLPPIRDLFGAELSRSVVPQTQPHPNSHSPQIPFHRLALADDPSRHVTQPPVPGQHGMAPAGRPYQSYPRDPRAPSSQTRNVLDPAGFHPASSSTHQTSHAYSHYGPPPSSMRTSSMNAPTSGQPASYHPHPSYSAQPAQSSSAINVLPVPEASGSERASALSSKYECEYCGKGFTRPSSLRIHLNTHTGDKPFTCPYEGCGRSFSVQSNMRRHARVHTREAASQQEADEESEEEK